MTGGPELTKFLTEDVEKLTGGKVGIGDDPVKVAQDIEAHIIKKRKALGI